VIKLPSFDYVDMKKQTRKKIIKILLQIAVYCAVGIFIYLTLKDNLSEIRDFEIRNVRLLIFTTLIYSASVGLNGYIWHLIMKFSGENIKIFDSIDVYISSYITRYIPGSVWAIFARSAMNKRYKVKMLKTAWGWFVENLGYLLVGGVFSLLVLSSLFESNIVLITVIPFVIAIGTIVYLNYEKMGKLFDKIIKRKLSRNANNKSSVLSLSLNQKIIILGLYLVSWIIYSLHYYLLAYSITGVTIEYLFPLVGVNALSYVIGYISIITPSGTGVREGVMIASLNLLGLVSKVEAIVVSIVARITFVIGEVGYLVVYKVVYFLYKKYDGK